MNTNRLDLRGTEGFVKSLSSGWLGSQTSKFRELTRSGQQFPAPLGASKLESLIGVMAAKIRLTSEQVQAFKNALRIDWQHGSYPAPSASASVLAWISLPYWKDSVLKTRELGASVYVQVANSKSGAEDAISAGSVELLRQVITEALVTWKGYVAPKVKYLGIGCRGSGGYPRMTLVSTPMIGRLARWDLTKARANTPAVFWLGFSDTKWGVIPLPLALDGAGGTGCKLYSDPVVPFARVTTPTGWTSVGFYVPLIPALVGQQLNGQFWIVDKGANPLGWTFSNGARATLGGHNGS